MSKKYLIVIVGPTAVGKTAMAIRLAERFESEILSADSRQFFKEMNIGTAKPTSTELDQIPHHFINTLSIHEHYDVGEFEREALALLDQLFLKHDVVFLVGGSGLYVDAVCNGLDEFPEVDAKIREDLTTEFSTYGLDHLVVKLTDLDPEYGKVVDLKNPQRVMRALEVCLSSGKPYSSFRQSVPKKRDFEIIKIGLELDREELYQRINFRMDQMILDGLFAEAESLEEFKHLNALQTVGYKEIYAYMNGDYDREEAIRLLKRNSRRFAKRQMTWFKRDTQTEWFNPNYDEKISWYIESEISKRLETEN